MIAFLALHPIRLKNFAALEIGRTLVRYKDAWWIVLPASETKEGRRDERPVDAMLASALDFYLSHCRQVLARTQSPPAALWLSSLNGRPLSYSMIENMISATTLSTIGIDVSPRLNVLKTVEPPGRKAGVKVKTVAELVDKLKNEMGLI